MAVKVSSWVWDNAKHLTGTDLLFMLALADKANDEEGACWPGVTRLTEMCRVKNTRAIQKISARLQEKGDIGVLLQAGGKTASGNTNKYFINGYRAFIGLAPIYSGNHPQSQDKELRKKFIGNPEGVNQRTPDAVSTETPEGVNQRTPKPSVEPSVEHIADSLPIDYSLVQETKNRTTKEPKVNLYYDAIKETFGYEGGRNGNMQKMLEGKSVINGYKQYNLNPPMLLAEFGEWSKDAKELGQFMPKSPEKVQDNIIKWRNSKVVKPSEPITPSQSVSASQAMSNLLENLS